MTRMGGAAPRNTTCKILRRLIITAANGRTTAWTSAGMCWSSPAAAPHMHLQGLCSGLCPHLTRMVPEARGRGVPAAGRMSSTDSISSAKSCSACSYPAQLSRPIGRQLLHQLSKVMLRRQPPSTAFKTQRQAMSYLLTSASSIQQSQLHSVRSPGNVHPPSTRL